MAKFQITSPDGKTFEITAPEGATQDEVLAYAQNSFAGKLDQPTPKTAVASKPAAGDAIVSAAGFNEARNSRFGNQLKGVASGFADIGNTILNADINSLEWLKNKIPGMSGKSAIKKWNDERNASLEALNQSNKDDTDYSVGKIAGNVAATWPVGGVLGAGVKSLSAAPAVQALGNAAASGGFKTGLQAAPQGASMMSKLATQLQNTGTRVAGGAATGAAATGLIAPEDAGTGALLGGALPVAVKTLGAAGGAIRNNIVSAQADEVMRQAQNATRDATIKAARDAGYVIPPTAANPTWLNRTLESIAGKDATKQAASVKNAEVTDRLARESIGLPADTALSEKALELARKAEGKSYAEVAAISPESSAALEALKEARNSSKVYHKHYDRSADPASLREAKAFDAQAAQIEQELEAFALAAGKPELIPALRVSRANIAKNYTLDRAMNDATGTIDAKVLARQSNNGTPLTGQQETIADFANAFPTAVRTPEAIGGDGVSKLKMVASMLMGGGGAAATGGMGVAAGAIPFIAPDLAKKLLLSQGYQNMAVNPKYGIGPTQKLIEALMNGADSAAPLTDEAYRLAPGLSRE